jgi:GDPmannose 4,6-dehydratase
LAARALAQGVRNTAVITGALGQDGSLLGEYLASLGHEVVGIVREIPAADRAIAPGGVRLRQMDIVDEAAWRELLSELRPEWIYHLAAAHHSSQEQAGKSTLGVYGEMLRVNFLSTRALAFAALDTVPGSHLVFAASSQMFAPHGACLAVDETTRRDPATLYGHSKSWSMDLLAFLRAQMGMHASTAILFNHESPRRSEQFVTRKITRMAAAAKLGLVGRMELGNLGARVDWSSASDVVRALYLMAQAGHADDYVVASGSLHSVRDVLDTAFGHLDLDWRLYATFREDVPAPALVGRSQKIEQALGWRRTVAFERMITDMVDADLERLARDRAPAPVRQAPTDYRDHSSRK